MPVVQDKYADKYRPSKSSTADLIPGAAIIRAINDNLNEHIEDTAENFKQVHSKLDGLADEFSAQKNDVSTLKGDVSTLKGDVSTLKTDVSTLKGDVSTLKTDVSTLKTDVSTLKTDMRAIRDLMESARNGSDQ